jgi:HK97 family phage major capsid protein
MECKHSQLSNIEELEKLSLKELQECNCDRCQPIAEKKELAELRAFRQEVEAKQMIQEEEKKNVELLQKAVQEFEKGLEGIREQIREEELRKAGLDKKGILNNPVFQSFMNHTFAPARKNVYVNTKYGREQLSPEMKNFVHWAATGEVYYKDLLGSTTGASVIPDELHREIVRGIEKRVAVLAAGARLFQMSSDRLDIPVETVRNSGAWVAEGAAYQEADPTLATVTLTPQKYTRLIEVSKEMLRDSGINVAEYLRDVFERDFTQAMDKAFLEGTGSGQPMGILKTAGITVNDAQATSGFGDNTAAFKAADLVAHQYSLDIQYHPRAAWVMNGKSAQAVRNMADSTGRLLWNENFGGISEGRPPGLLGNPVYLTGNITTDGTDGDRIIFGDFSYYAVGMRQGIEVERSEHVSFKNGLVAFRADLRVDGKVLLTDAFKILKKAS